VWLEQSTPPELKMEDTSLMVFSAVVKFCIVWLLFKLIENLLRSKTNREPFASAPPVSQHLCVPNPPDLEAPAPPECTTDVPPLYDIIYKPPDDSRDGARDDPPPDYNTLFP